MSLEHFPNEERSLHELAHMCEEALLLEDWSSERSNDEKIQYRSVQLCEELKRNFERQYHLIGRREVAYRSYKKEFPPSFFDGLWLENPKLLLPNIDEEKSFYPLRIPEGQVFVNYLDIRLESTCWQIGEGEDAEIINYTGAHLICASDFSSFDTMPGDTSAVTNSLYIVYCPFKTVDVVPDPMRPQQFN